VHAFASAACTFFTPALATGLWLFARQELFTQTTHVTTILYVLKVGSGQLKLATLII
jgi:hypothetical protein